MKRPWVLLVVAGLFFIGFIANVVNGEVGVGDTVFQAVAIALALGTYAFVSHQQRRRDELVRFLATSVDELRAGRATFGGALVTYATQLRSYELVISYLIVTVRYQTRPVLDGARGSRSIPIAASLATFLLGWFGIPWGPIWTVRALVRNARGGDPISVGALLEGAATSELAPARVR